MKKSLIAVATCLLIGSGNLVAKPAEFTLPDMQPVWESGKAINAEKTREMRNSYTYTAMLDAADLGAYVSSRLTEFLPTATVSRSGQVAELEYQIMPEIGEVRFTSDLGELSLNEVLQDPRSRMRAIMVLHKGKVVFEQYPGLRPYDSHFWASAAKTVVSLLAAQLASDGQLDLKKPVDTYLPELKATAWEGIALEHILHQHAGLDINERSMGEPGHPITDFYRAAAGDENLPEGADFMSAVKKAETLSEPGQFFEYSSMNTFVLGAVLERVTKQPMQDLIGERIWRKVGMEGDAHLGLSASGEPAPMGVFSSRLSDLARYGLLYTPSWNVVSEMPVVPEDYLEQVYESADHSSFLNHDYLGQRIVKNFNEKCVGASYQWDAVFCDGDLYKSGRTGQALYVSPETDTVVVWFSSSYQNKIWMEGYTRQIVEQVFRQPKDS